MKNFVLILSLIVCTSINAQKGNFINSNWRDDGNAQMTIPSDQYSFSKKEKLYYFVSNNGDNIYIDMKIEDSEVQSRILQQGLIVWVDMDGKSAKKMGIRFPIGSKNSGGRRNPNMVGETLGPDGKPATPLSMANTIELTGFVSEENRRFPAENADSFSGSVAYDKDGVLFYKMKMPISKLPVRNTKDGTGTMPVTLGIEYGAAPPVYQQGGQRPPSAMPSSGSSSGGSRGGSSGGRPAGGARGSGGQGGAPGQVQAPSVTLWIKNIKLASGK